MASSSKKQDELMEAGLGASPRAMKRAVSAEGKERLQAVVAAVGAGKPEEAPEVPDAALEVIAPSAPVEGAVVTDAEPSDAKPLFTKEQAQHIADVATGRTEPLTEEGKNIAPVKAQTSAPKRPRKPKGETSSALAIVISQDRLATGPGTKRNPRRLKTQPRETRFTTIHFNDLTLKWLELAKGLTGRTMAAIVDEATQRYLASVPGMPGIAVIKKLMEEERKAKKAMEKGQ
jgi:hypothetical protein